MSNYSIKDLEQLSGIKAHTLRIWEQRYNIINPKRTDTNIRTYDDNDLKLVLNIALLKDHDYKISEIAKLSLEELSKEVLAISDKQLNYPDQIHALTIAMIDIDEERFEKIMSTNILQFGFENTMINIIYPFLSRIGTLWVTGSIGPAQEHFITNLIRQKIIVAIDGQIIKPNADSKKYILYTPEGEFHEIPLLFANFILRARHNKVIYLGQSMPFSELQFICQHHKPDCLFTVITSTPGQDEIQQYVNKLGDSFPDVKILLTGYQVIAQGLDLPKNAEVVNNVRQLMEFAEG
ncbi:MerR family transcriptional regulator [Emticicia aquatilis]|uniref:MerR family transcriptional regulator n=2 Tax=Emticicia TaxID=312278 RepID=A0A916YXM5_9BACT|nr:MerR family transcriptional regulator [Emticicia aquatilis]GGD65846.1 MerR family transcriptional regulator [Emticicia aquatilis]